MKNMIKIITLSVVALAATSAFGDVVFETKLRNLGLSTFNKPGGGQTGGGAFEVSGLRNGVPANIRFAQGMVDGSLRKLTFCVDQVAFSPNTWYDTTIDADIQFGNSNVNGPTLQTITKNIYAHYYLGNLAPIANGVAGIAAADFYGNSAVNKALQGLFWDLQGVNGGTGALQGFNYAQLNATQKALYDGFAALANNNPVALASRVQALNLWIDSQVRDPGGDVQSQLVIVVPTPGAAVLGLIGVVSALRRRFI